MSGLNVVHLLELVVRPTLIDMGFNYSSVEAEQLVMGTAAVESMGFTALRQFNGGPARGLWQCEPFTFNDLVNRYPHEMLYRVSRISQDCSMTPDMVAWNLRLGAMMCRLKYRDDPDPLPRPNDIAGMAALHKRHYNTAGGATSSGQFERAWADYIAPSARRMWP